MAKLAKPRRNLAQPFPSPPNVLAKNPRRVVLVEGALKSLPSSSGVRMGGLLHTALLHALA
eukprot:358524-Chlamydomonas_euryale.AAC.3